jgi:haloacetate dehalogenase
MFDGFERRTILGDGVDLHAVVGGSGPPLLLLHGYPQSHVCWHKVAPLLADAFTVVASDLRGYGDSGKPPGDDRHETYSKRRMAADQVRVMAALGFERFFLAGHDRGGRVAHRLALDYPGAVRKLAVLDIAPTLAMYLQADMRFATAYYHWFFLIQPCDLPERLIGADPDYFLRQKLIGLGGSGSGMGPFTPAALAEYLRCFRDPATIHASCEDYRASASIDLEHDEADLARKLTCPVLALWGAAGRLARCYDVLPLWRERAEDVRGEALPCGHFLAEEVPEQTAARLREFFLNG